VYKATNQPDTKSNPNPNLTTKQHAVVNIQLNIVTCLTYSEKFIRDNVVARFLLLSVVIITLPFQLRLSSNFIWLDMTRYVANAF